MSSFRPDFEPADFAFAPLVWSRLGDDGFAATATATAPEARSHDDGPAGNAAESASADAPVSEAPMHSAEEVAELEAAAFARGAESATVQTQSIERAFAALEAAAGALRTAVRTEPSRNREQILQLATLIATRWVGAELRQDPARFGEMLERAFAADPDASRRKLHLSAEDHALLVSDWAERLAEWSETRGVELVVDADLERGAFRVETPRTSIDGRPEAIRSRLEEALAETLGAPLEEGAE